MSRMLILQLERFGRLAPEEKLALTAMRMRSRRVGARQDLAQENDGPDLDDVLLAGFACRYVVLPNGRRQVLAYILPGECCGRRMGSCDLPEHAIATLSAAKIGTFAREELTGLAYRFPNVARALELSHATEQATLYQWLLNLGQRTALERTAHMLCELFVRLGCLGLTHNGGCEVPLRQADVADALAISAVHLNRTLTRIRRLGMGSFLRNRLLIEDFPALQKLAGFRPDYLFAGTQAPVYSVPVLKDSRTRMDAAQPADMGAGSPISSG
jgi:CRP-like cAMP-binding protein